MIETEVAVRTTPDESSLQHVHRVGRIIVERQIACSTTDQRHDNTDQRDNEGRKTGGFQLVQISIHTCVKHQDDYTDLSGLYQKIGLAYPAEAARANQHTGNQCTDNLRLCTRSEVRPNTFVNNMMIAIINRKSYDIVPTLS